MLEEEILLLVTARVFAYSKSGCGQSDGGVELGAGVGALAAANTPVNARSQERYLMRSTMRLAPPD